MAVFDTPQIPAALVGPPAAETARTNSEPSRLLDALVSDHRLSSAEGPMRAGNYPIISKRSEMEQSR